MFTQPVSSPPPGPQAGNPVSPSRSSRLRGLSYLRNYTHNHLLSRDSHHSSSSNGNSNNNNNNNHSNHNRNHTSVSSSSGGNNNINVNVTASASASANINTNASSRTQAHSGNLTRSVSYTPSSTLSPASQNPHRLTLVSSSPDPAPAPSSQARESGVSLSSPPPTIPEITPSSPLQAPATSQNTSLDSTTPSGQLNMNATGLRAASDAPTAAGNGNGNGNGVPETVPSIRFSAHYDLRSTRPSLSFSPISRTLPNGTEIIRVGRYSERDGQAANVNNNQPSAAPVGFKSKVVSRRHCELWCEDGKWFIRDVKSSSGTFLNHIRLSPPSQESKAYPVNDGDIVQLGIDFKGGEEMIFRCVKMRLELNRGWQTKLNSFNVAAHKRLRTMATGHPAGGASASGSQSSQDCSICLNSIAPCQSLFVAPCSHTWHFKCVRSLLASPQYPIFVCPNCRAGADLEADVDEPSEDWQQLDDDGVNTGKKEPQKPQTEGPPATSSSESVAPDTDAMDITMSVNMADSPGGRSVGNLPHTATEPLPIRSAASGSWRVGHLRANRSPSPSSSGAEGPITPRNNAGPWVFDGSAGQRAANGNAEMRSLDAEMDLGN
ncbi:FHA domain containing protein [Metarhizium rileyi]|uniref:RING-type E3 ubiquitin transferase n=1 Tax=Metarhizium rileyi (strain RCEF 4871) TaxID=1649241 RepID=A0A166ZY44_METRR|nr:FHA domain containing protein [Metarhizium rileyi RCEF 4871]